MSEKLLKILLEEIEVVRIVCEKCKTGLEFPLANLSEAFFNRRDSDWACPHCNQQIMGDSTGAATGGPFLQLLKAINSLKDCRKKIGVQFVIKDQ